MKNQDIPFELVAFSEIDKFASKSYSLIHGIPEEMNLGDITKIDEKQLGQVDFITYGFPCQDISVAGYQKGFENDNGEKTRSGLFFDALRIITHTHPRVAIAENVKNLTSDKFREQFKTVLQSLNDAGYNNYWRILNAKDYGIPQNRERIFIVSIRKDADHQVFQFPKPYPLHKRMKDLLEKNVDEKYIISEDGLKYMNRRVKGGRTHWDFNHHNDSDNEVANCLTANMMKGVPYNVLIDRTDRIIQVGNCRPTLNCQGGGNREPHILLGDVIRKMTPLECFRFMGFDDADYQILAEHKISNTQQYKMAGNSIVVDVAEELLCMLFDEDGIFLT